jgi:DNA-binding NarL/FixJ family response regulator
MSALSILTVEDDPLVRAGLRLILEDNGFEVCAAARNGPRRSPAPESTPLSRF